MAAPAFDATFSIINQASAPLRTIRSDMHVVGEEADRTGKKVGAAFTHAHHAVPAPVNETP